MRKVDNKMTVILVANGASMLGSGLGKAIDSHDIVMRLNNYVVNGYEEDVGQKTTHHFRTYDIRPKWGKLPHIIPPEHNHGIMGLQHDPMLCLKAAVFSPQFAAQHRSKCPEYSLYKACIEVDQPCMSRCRTACKYTKGWVSTGALAVWYSVEQWNKIDICGFDCLQKDADTIDYGYYYLPNKFPKVHGKNHDLLLEAEMISSLINDGKVTVVRKENV